MMSNWTAASSDCSRPANNYVRVNTVDLYTPNARFTPERLGYQVLTLFGKLGYSLFFGLFASALLLGAPEAGLAQSIGDHTYSSADIEAGSRLYVADCRLCHGAFGSDVDGVNLRLGQFRRPLSDEDLRQVITTGVDGERMPGFDLQATELDALAARGREAPTDALLFLIAVVRSASKVRVPGRSALGLPQLLIEVVHALAQVVNEACAALLADRPAPTTPAAKMRSRTPSTSSDFNSCSSARLNANTFR